MNCGERNCSRGSSELSDMGPLAVSRASAISVDSARKAHAQPRRRPRPRAMASPIRRPGRPSTRTKATAWPRVKTAARRAEASAPASSAPERPPRSRCRTRGNGERRASGNSRGTRSEAEKRAAEPAPAPRMPPIRGSGLAPVCGRPAPGCAGADRGPCSFIDPYPSSTPPPNLPHVPSVGREGQECYVAGPLDGHGQLALVLRAGPEHPPGEHLAALGDERGQELHVLVVDVVDLVRAELADLAPAEEVALALVLRPAPARAAARGPRPPTPAAPAPAAAV